MKALQQEINQKNLLIEELDYNRSKNSSPDRNSGLDKDGFHNSQEYQEMK